MHHILRLIDEALAPLRMFKNHLEMVSLVAHATKICYAMGMRDELTAPRLHAWRALLNAYGTAIDAVERELCATACLPLSSLEVLLALERAPDGRLRMSEIADAVVLSRSALTRQVDRLQQQGLLQRETCDTDRRGSFAALTDEGRRIVRDSWPIYRAGIEQHFGSLLNDGEVEVLTSLLNRIAAPIGGTELDRTTKHAEELVPV